MNGSCLGVRDESSKAGSHSYLYRRAAAPPPDPRKEVSTVLSALKPGCGPRAPADAAFALAVLASYAIHAGFSAGDAINDPVS